MGRLIRYILIIHRLSGHKKYVPADELISFLNLQMELRGYEVGISQRTLQRDMKEICQMFEIEIKNCRGYGYYIADKTEETDIRYQELLLNFDLLTSMNQGSQSIGFIIPEHHRPKGSDNIPVFISAIKEHRVVEFDYTLVRKGDKVISKKVKPHFLKESLGLWYLLALDEHDALRSYGIDRMQNIHITDTTFKQDESIDNDSEFRISLRLRITNDFVMALLSRSASLTVIKPLSLRARIRDIYKDAIERNN